MTNTELKKRSLSTDIPMALAERMDSIRKAEGINWNEKIRNYLFKECGMKPKECEGLIRPYRNKKLQA